MRVKLGLAGWPVRTGASIITSMLRTENAGERQYISIVETQQAHAGWPKEAVPTEDDCVEDGPCENHIRPQVRDMGHAELGHLPSRYIVRNSAPA